MIEWNIYKEIPLYRTLLDYGVFSHEKIHGCQSKKHVNQGSHHWEAEAMLNFNWLLNLSAKEWVATTFIMLRRHGAWYFDGRFMGCVWRLIDYVGYAGGLELRSRQAPEQNWCSYNLYICLICHYRCIILSVYICDITYSRYS